MRPPDLYDEVTGEPLWLRLPEPIEEQWWENLRLPDETISGAGVPEMQPAIDPYDPLLISRMGNLIDEGWTVAPEPYIDYRKAFDAVSTRYGYPQPRIIETFKKAGVLIHDEKSGNDYIDVKRVLKLCPYLANKLGKAPKKVLLKRSMGMV